MTTITDTQVKLIVLGGQAVKHYEDGGEYIIHPLFDTPETKVAIEHMGPLHLTGASRWSLIGLRVYLVFGMLALLYYVVQVATGAIH
jgi:hypothetical protein